MIEQLLKLNTLEDVHAIAGIDVDEIFKESQKHVDKSDEKPLRDFDFD